MSSEIKFSILNKTKKPPLINSGLLKKIKNHTLGKDYELSLVFIGNKKSKQLNSSFRGKNKPANILSFPLEKKAGEIFIDLTILAKEAKKFNLSKKNFLIKLFIHGLCHLKGMQHSSKMDNTELAIQKKFGFKF